MVRGAIVHYNRGAKPDYNLQCATTGRVITADTKKKTYTNDGTAEWIYLLGWHPDNPNKRIYVKEEIILQEVEQVLATLHLEPELLAEVIGYIKNSTKIEQGFYKMRIGELHTEHTKIKTRMDRLTDLFLDGDISKEDHEEKRQQLIQKREDIMRELESHNYADDEFSELLINLVELASRALETFKGSNIEKKRKLLNLVFSNLKLKDGKLDFMLRPPFDAFVKCTKIGEWLGRMDSNHRMTIPKTVALPLGYAPSLNTSV